MSDTFKVKVQLLILSINLENNTQQIVSLGDDIQIPSDLINHGEVVEDVIHRLCKYFVDLDPDWVSPKIDHVYVDNDELYIVYGAVIPMTTTLLHSARFVPVPMTNQQIMGVVQNYGFIW